jgi:hypothetical protein
MEGMESKKAIGTRTTGQISMHSPARKRLAAKTPRPRPLDCLIVKLLVEKFTGQNSILW